MTILFCFISNGNDMGHNKSVFPVRNESIDSIDSKRIKKSNVIWHFKNTNLLTG